MTRSPRVVAVVDLGSYSACLGNSPESRFSMRRLNAQNLLSRIVRRLSECELIDGIVITGADLPSDLVTCIGAQAEVVDMRLEHVCQRLAAAADRTGAEWIYYVPGNRPFVDPVLADSLIAHARRNGDCDYVGFVSRDDHVRRIHQLGLAGELVHVDCLRRLRRNVDRLQPAGEGTEIADWIASAPGTYQMRFVPINEELDRSDLRFVLEDEADWDLATVLCDAVSDDRTDWQSLQRLVEVNPYLQMIMADRNRAAQERTEEATKFASSAQAD